MSSQEYRRQYYLRNRERVLQQSRDYYQKQKTANPEAFKHKRRNIKLKSRYGVTLEQYNAMVEAQGGRCAICQLIPDNPLFLDHCHVSGTPRSLLCPDCNFMLGAAKDRIPTLLAGAAYVQQHDKHSTQV